MDRECERLHGKTSLSGTNVKNRNAEYCHNSNKTRRLKLRRRDIRKLPRIRWPDVQNVLFVRPSCLGVGASYVIKADGAVSGPGYHSARVSSPRDAQFIVMMTEQLGDRLSVEG